MVIRCVEMIIFHQKSPSLPMLLEDEDRPGDGLFLLCDGFFFPTETGEPAKHGGNKKELIGPHHFFLDKHMLTGETDIYYT